MEMKKTIGIVSIAFIWCIVVLDHIKADELPFYAYECRQNGCVKVPLDEERRNTAISLSSCRILCNSDSIGTLWPKPNGKVKVDPYLIHINLSDIKFNALPSNRYQNLWNFNQKRFIDSLQRKLPNGNKESLKNTGHPLIVNILIKNAHRLHDDYSSGGGGGMKQIDEEPQLTLATDESYYLDIITTKDYEVIANISAATYFGGRHALATLIQLIVFDDIRNELQILAKVNFEDKPAFKWRGLLLDTSRNFYSVKSIMRTLDGMAMVKLNTFHWHITDSHSFPMEIKSRPDLHKSGAYSSKKIYTNDDIRSIVKYGRKLGIRVMPEFDAPSHVGEGWQNTNMTVCFNAQPWDEYCVEPPCGQLNPTINEVYDVLEDIYREMFDLFDPDVFHMGGDEVSIKCWSSTATIRDWMKLQGWNLAEADFLRLWDYFQSKALRRVQRLVNDKPMPIILWTSKLTQLPYLDKYLNSSNYFIQIWTKGDDVQVKDLLSRGFNIIVSNYDALYFDCGASSWVSDGHNWCSPYIGWKTVYNNRMENIAKGHIDQILGAEAAVWSEQIDEHTLDQRLWPRASALAERLWTNPANDWRIAESRLLLHRQQLIENGIAADIIQPEWCLQNQNQCTIQ